MVKLIKKGGLRERANRSSKYSQSENMIKTLDPHRYTNQENGDLQDIDKLPDHEGQLEQLNQESNPHKSIKD